MNYFAGPITISGFDPEPPTTESQVLAWVVLAAVVGATVWMWQKFTKARRPGWAALVPVYNLIVLFQLTRSPFALLLIPVQLIFLATALLMLFFAILFI
jgi:hypothetical protein